MRPTSPTRPPAPVDYLLAGLAFRQISVLEQSLENYGVETYGIECEATADECGVRDDHPKSCCTTPPDS